MKNYFNGFLAFIYFIVLYVFKEGYVFPGYKEIINEYLSLQALYDISLALLFVIVITTIIKGVFGKVEAKIQTKSIVKNLIPAIKQTLIVVVWFFGIVAIASNLGFDVKALLAGAGIGGLALAMASQNTVANIFGAVTILTNRPFDLGDDIIVEGQEGKVENIGFTYMSLKNADGNIVLIPNAKLTATIVVNKSRGK